MSPSTEPRRLDKCDQDDNITHRKRMMAMHHLSWVRDQMRTLTLEYFDRMCGREEPVQEAGQ